MDDHIFLGLQTEDRLRAEDQAEKSHRAYERKRKEIYWVKGLLLLQQGEMVVGSVKGPWNANL